MAVRKELWARTIIEGLYPDDSFMTKSIDDSQYVYLGKKVHVPQAGAAPKVEKNRTSLPATAKKRDDTDLEYEIAEFTTDPVYIPNADNYELSFSKRESVVRVARNELMEKVAADMLLNWAPGSTETYMATGAEVDAYQASATGKRKMVSRQDVLNLMTMFDRQNIPQSGRYLLLDAVMYGQLLSDLTESDKNMFLASANAAQGVLGNLYGFNIMKRSEVLRYSSAKSAVAASSSTATDLPAGLAWHQDAVSRALGDVKAFVNNDNALWYGDILSFLIRTGGHKRRSDKKGVMAVLGTTGGA